MSDCALWEKSWGRRRAGFLFTKLLNLQSNVGRTEIIGWINYLQCFLPPADTWPWPLPARWNWLWSPVWSRRSPSVSARFPGSPLSVPAHLDWCRNFRKFHAFLPLPARWLSETSWKVNYSSESSVLVCSLEIVLVSAYLATIPSYSSPVYSVMGAAVSAASVGSKTIRLSSDVGVLAD